jgi:putative transposase
MNCYARPSKAVLRRPVDSGQYASNDFRDVLKEYGITASMSRRGDCWDTQSTMAMSAASGLTRAGTGVMPLC